MSERPYDPIRVVVWIMIWASAVATAFVIALGVFVAHLHGMV